LSLIKKTIKVL